VRSREEGAISAVLGGGDNPSRVNSTMNGAPFSTPGMSTGAVRTAVIEELE
jgi:hypothetical protein